MAVRPHYPSAAAKQAAYRARKQAAQALAARACAAIQQALQTRALADQSWELYELIDAWSRDPDMPRQVPAGRPPGPLAGTSAHLYGVAAARVRRHRRALQRLAHVRATRASPGGRAERSVRTRAYASPLHTRTVRGSCEGTWRERPATDTYAPWHKRRVCHRHSALLILGTARCLCRLCRRFCVTEASSLHDGLSWTNYAARAMMSAVRHEALRFSAVSS